jgi:hypothetical protein
MQDITGGKEHDGQNDKEQKETAGFGVAAKQFSVA